MSEKEQHSCDTDAVVVGGALHKIRNQFLCCLSLHQIEWGVS